MSKILVVGSSNIDLTARVEHLPVPGETVTNARFEQALGGKGANQAVAAARLGGDVTFVTMLGQDAYADQLRNQFKSVGIATEYVLDTPAAPTGTAFIFVSAKGENCIAVAPGANALLTPDKVDLFRDAIDAADLTDGTIGILDLMSKGGLIASNGEGRRLVQQGGVSVDGEKVTDPATKITAERLQNGVVIKKGKKVFHKFTV